MWLLFDIGNTSTKIGAFNPGTVGYDIVTIPTDAADEDVLVEGFVGAEVFNRAVLSSVVPVKLKRYADILSARGIDAVTVSAEIKLPFRIGYRTPQTLGADRIAGAAGALAYVRAEMPGTRNVVSVDAGTAVTFASVVMCRQKASSSPLKPSGRKSAVMK